MNDEYNATMKARKVISGIRSSAAFQSDDSLALYQAIQSHLRPLDFGFYLRRYIHQAAGYPGTIDSVSVQDYTETILHAFANEGVPVSLKPTSTKPRAAIKNWLSQKTVSREAVIMLGFGLGMSLSDINMFFTKALQENSLNPKDPVETICWYCLQNHKDYYHFHNLLSLYNALPGTEEQHHALNSNSTMLLRAHVEDLKDDDSLLQYLNQLRRIDGKSKQSTDARKIFLDLFEKSKEIIANLNNAVESEQTEIEISRLREKLSHNDRLYEEQKNALLQKHASRVHQWTKEEITPVSFEEVLFSSVPKDRHDNLLPMKGSSLNEQFRGKRLSRQHIQEILDGNGSINRYDLSTMSFFVLSQDPLYEDRPILRYRAFIDKTNAILEKCGMGELYPSNPYEAFLMMCVLTDYPLGTYADVWELSYESDH